VEKTKSQPLANKVLVVNLQRALKVTDLEDALEQELQFKRWKL
jgi:hypothetical protein